MTEALLLAMRFAAALGCGLMAGLFFAFSVAVMGGLARIEPAAGIAAMQAINRVILNPLFAVAFFGTAVICALAVLTLIWRWPDAGAVYLAIGGALYLVGVFLVTIVFNVPLNNALDAIAPTSPEGAQRWTGFLSNWTAWNHVRTATAFIAALLHAIAIHLEARGAGS